MARPVLSTHRLVRPAACLIAGAAVSISVALVRDVVHDEPVVYHRPVSFVGDLDWLDAALPDDLERDFIVNAGFDSWRSHGSKRVLVRLGEDRTQLIFFRRTPEAVDRTPAGTALVERLRRGWPFRCLEGTQWTMGVGATAVDRRLLRFEGLGTRAIELPWGPLPVGLLVNATIYGFAIWLMVTMPGAAERWFRRRGDRCERCGHPLRSTDRCPECGHERVRPTGGAPIAP